MQLQYIEPLFPVDLKPWFIFEACIVLTNMVLFTCYTIIVSKASLHINLKVVCLSVVLQYFPSMISRLIILAYQSSILTPPINPESSLPIILCSFFRCYHMSICLGLPFWLWIERHLAMVYIHDYERISRKWIGVIIVIFCSLFCGTLTFIYIFAFVPFDIISPILLLLGIFGMIKFFCIVRKAKEMELELIKAGKNSAINYSLSVRFQLEENLWSSRLIRDAILSLAFINFIGIMAFLASHASFARERFGLATTQFMDSIFNICIAINGPLVAIGSMFYNDYLLKLARSTLCGSQKSDEPNAGQVYFNQLDRQWNHVKSK